MKEIEIMKGGQVREEGIERMKGEQMREEGSDRGNEMVRENEGE